MSTVAKFLVGLALVLPMTGYVVGSLVSSSAREPDQRAPVIVSDVRQVAPTDAGRSPAPRPVTKSLDNRKVDQNGITVLRPEPQRPDEGDEDDDGDNRDGGDDDRDETDDTDDDDD